LVDSYPASTALLEAENNMKNGDKKRKKIYFFGHFGSPNFGNEITFQTALYHVRYLLPEAEVACICTGPEALAATQNIETVPISRTFVKPGKRRSRLGRFLRSVFIGVPSEVYRWFEAFKMLKGSNMFIIPGTGLLTDAFGLRGWGPYDLFKWTAMAKLRRSKVLFVSVGAGPIYSVLGRYFVRSALSLADYRSYRDDASMKYLMDIGFPTNSDRVYPDLVFSLPQTVVPDHRSKRRTRPVVGIGLMANQGKYSAGKPSNAVYLAYLENLILLIKWLLDHGYDIRLLIGDAYDQPLMEEFKSLLTTRLGVFDDTHILHAPATSAEQLVAQLAGTDIVVATRFHNILLALLLNKPVISISFHHKCASLMEEMGLSEYCHDINHMNADRLIAQFQDLEKKAARLKPAIRQRVEQSRKALDEQYSLIFKDI
jgi:polysaccharide pyruvyl transferase WcaK-like protein